MSNNNSRRMKPKEKGNGALGFEATLWATADKLRGNLAAPNTSMSFWASFS